MSHNKKSVLVTILLGFLVSLPVALPAYINSSFLSSFSTETAVSITFSVASLLSIAIIALVPKILRKIGNTDTALIFICAAFLSFIGLAFFKEPYYLISLFLINYAALIALSLNLDIFLEHSSANTSTGSIRGIYLVLVNLAWVVSQLVIVLLISDHAYSKIFMLSGLLLLPVFFIIWKHFKDFLDPNYARVSMVKSLKTIIKKHEFSDIFSINFLLQFFYAWMVIYTPIYLLNYIGFSWTELGLMFAIMLLPFVIVEWPLGKIADKFIGEKEMLVAGFSIMAITAISIPFITVKSFFVWTAILFLSRVGASMVEVMSETYFFKKVNDKDIALISMFRTTRPWAYVAAPLLAAILLALIDFKSLFYFLGMIMLVGIRQSLMLKDTK